MKAIKEYYENAMRLKPTLELLNEIHRLFVHETLFSSIDIMLGLKPTFDAEAAYKKVVVRGEGGTCGLINLAAKHLLEKIGFTCHCISADVTHIHKIRVPQNSAIHITMIVSFNDSRNNLNTYLFDPGFGNSHRVPLPLTGEVVEDVMTSHRATYDKATNLVTVEEYWGEWLTQFTFDPSHFMDQNGFDQHIRFTYQDSHFYRNNLYVQQCSEEGAIRLYNDRIITLKSNGEEEEVSVVTGGGVRRVLMKGFKLPKHFVDSIISQTAQMTQTTQTLIKKNWEPSPLVLNKSLGSLVLTEEEVLEIISKTSVML